MRPCRRLKYLRRGERRRADLRNLRAVLLNLLDLAEPDSNITAAVDEVFEAALAYQGEFAHAAKAGTDAAYHFLLLSAARMERSLAALRACSGMQSRVPPGGDRAS